MIRSRGASATIAVLVSCLSSRAAAYAQSRSVVTDAIQKGEPVTIRASGSFEVKMSPQAPEDKAEGVTLARMSIEKQFHGDLEATTKGELLTVAGVKGSAGYVLIERVNGTLHGRGGTFVLQHSATMTRGAPQQSITVVPDSGTGQLVGLAGKMTIQIANGKHSYDFEYTIGGTP